MQRTNAQSRAMHKLFDEIGIACLAQGIDQKVIINNFRKFETPVTSQSVKEVWRIIQVNMTGKESTTELTTGEVHEVYEVFAKFWASLGVDIAFPSIEALLDRDVA